MLYIMKEKKFMWIIGFSVALVTLIPLATTSQLAEQDVSFLLNGEESIPKANKMKKWFLLPDFSSYSYGLQSRFQKRATDDATLRNNSEWWNKWKEFNKRSSFTFTESSKNSKSMEHAKNDDMVNEATKPSMTYFIQDVDKLFLRDDIIRDTERTSKIELKTLRDRLRKGKLPKADAKPNETTTQGSVVEYLTPGVDYVTPHVRYVSPQVEYIPPSVEVNPQHIDVPSYVRYVEPQVEYAYAGMPYRRNNSVARRTPKIHGPVRHLPFNHNIEKLQLYLNGNKNIPKPPMSYEIPVVHSPVIPSTNTTLFIDNPGSRRMQARNIIHPIPEDIMEMVKPEMFRATELEDSIPGIPNQDYPVFEHIPNTGFRCSSMDGYGYYADIETGCQVFHLCHDSGRQSSFLCPIGTVFHQRYLVCDWWYNVHCEDSTNYYHKQVEGNSIENLSLEGSAYQRKTSVPSYNMLPMNYDISDTVNFDDDSSVDYLNLSDELYSSKFPKDDRFDHSKNENRLKTNPFNKAQRSEYFGGSKPYISPLLESDRNSRKIPLEKEVIPLKDVKPNSRNYTVNRLSTVNPKILNRLSTANPKLLTRLPTMNSKILNHLSTVHPKFKNFSHSSKIPFALFQSQAFERGNENSSSYAIVPKNKILKEWWSGSLTKKKGAYNASQEDENYEYPFINFDITRESADLKNEHTYNPPTVVLASPETLPHRKPQSITNPMLHYQSNRYFHKPDISSYVYSTVAYKTSGPTESPKNVQYQSKTQTVPYAENIDSDHFEEYDIFDELHKEEISFEDSSKHVPNDKEIEIANDFEINQPSSKQNKSRVYEYIFPVPANRPRTSYTTRTYYTKSLTKPTQQPQTYTYKSPSYDSSIASTSPSDDDEVTNSFKYGERLGANSSKLKNLNRLLDSAPRPSIKPSRIQNINALADIKIEVINATRKKPRFGNTLKPKRVYSGKSKKDLKNETRSDEDLKSQKPSKVDKTDRRKSKVRNRFKKLPPSKTSATEDQTASNIPDQAPKVSLSELITISGDDGHNGTFKEAHIVSAKSLEKFSSTPSASLDSLPFLDISRFSIEPNQTNPAAEVKNYSVSMSVETRVLPTYKNVGLWNRTRGRNFDSSYYVPPLKTDSRQMAKSDLISLLRARERRNSMVALSQESFKEVEKILLNDGHRDDFQRVAKDDIISDDSNIVPVYSGNNQHTSENKE